MNGQHATRAKGSCVHTLLTRGRQLEITYCSCGNVHVTWGSVTLRLLPEDFSVFSDGLVEAAGALAEVVRDGHDRPAGRLLV